MKYIYTTLIFAILITTLVFSEEALKVETDIKNTIQCEEGEIAHGKCICTYSCKKRNEDVNEDGTPKCDKGEILDCYILGPKNYICTCVKQINVEEDEYESTYEKFCQQRKNKCAFKTDKKWNEETCTCDPLTPNEQIERDKGVDALKDIFKIK